MSQIEFKLNGKLVKISHSDPGVNALTLLRDYLGVISPKNGCSPQGQCGACTVLIDGKAMMICTRPAEFLDGKEVTTLEGLPLHQRRILEWAFTEKGAMQCGFCIPGIAMRTASLLNKGGKLDQAKIRNALQPHLCRCTGYIKIFEAVEEAAKYWNSEEVPELTAETGVGASAPRYLGDKIVTGNKPYVDDLTRPDMLYGAVLLSEYPRAEVLSIDVSEALQMPGVKAVLTAEDLPAAKKVGLIEKDWPVFIGVGEVTHCVGSVIAAVAAETRTQALRAAEKIRVEYRPLEPVTDPEEALKEGAPQVHPGRSNLLRVSEVKKGDADAALKKCHLVLTETFQTQRVEHAFIEPESALAVPGEGGAVEVYSQGQGVFDDRRQIASVLGVEEDKVRVVLVSNGGAFGGKEDLSIQAHAALLAIKTGRPVKLTLTREQSIRLHPKRHPLKMTYTVGVDENGYLQAVKARIIGDTGAYASVGDKVLERAAGHSCGAYHVPNVDVTALTVYTNNLPAGAFRGFGVNQVAFAMEGMLDRLADKLGIDRFEIRYKNALRPGQRFATGQIMDESTGVVQCLEAVKDVYYSAEYAGIACGIKNTGIGNGMADIGRALLVVNSDNSVTIFTGFTEMGQGLFTVLRQIAAGETGLPEEVFEVEVNTDFAVECGMTTASRATVLSGEAVKRAAVKLREALKENGGDLSKLKGEKFYGEFICDFTHKPGEGGDNPVTHLTFGYAAQVVILNSDGTIKKVVAAHDVGKAINPTLCEGQIEGAVHMGLGYALTEELPCFDGYPFSTKINDMGIIRAKHVPSIEVKLIEVKDKLGPYGAKGVGEIGLVPTAAAVAGALSKFEKKYRNVLPMKDSVAAKGLGAKPVRRPQR